MGSKKIVVNDFRAVSDLRLFTAFAAFILLMVPSLTVAQTANPNANSQTKAILTYFEGLKGRTINRVLSGQHISHDGWDAASGYGSFIESLKNTTGKYPAIVGIGMTAPDLINAILAAKTHWDNGGLVQVDAHFDNPFTGTDSWVENAAAAKGNLYSLIPNHPQFNQTAYTRWKAMLDRTAGALKQLQDAGVTVLWRPLHENNGTWFWWGVDSTNPSNTEPFKALWRSMFDYYTNTWKLNNLLWVYAASPSWDLPVQARYPGSAFVDIVGLDLYDDNLTLFRPSDYTELAALNKPLGFAESGPIRHDGMWNNLTLSDALRTRYPAFVYLLQWHSWKNSNGTTAKVALIDNLNASGLFQDQLIVTRDELNRSAPTSPPPTPTSTPRPVATNTPTPTPTATASSTQNLCPPSVSGSPGSVVRNGATVTEAVRTGGLAYLRHGDFSQRFVSLSATGSTTLLNSTSVQTYRVNNRTNASITVSLQADSSGLGYPTVRTVTVPAGTWAFVATPYTRAPHKLINLSSSNARAYLRDSWKAPVSWPLNSTTLVDCRIP